jgi:hypothetical protein
MEILNFQTIHINNTAAFEKAVTAKLDQTKSLFPNCSSPNFDSTRMLGKQNKIKNYTYFFISLGVISS